MSSLLKPVSPEALQSLKASLSKWSAEKFGSLESDFGNKISIIHSKAYDIFEVSLNTLYESRSRRTKKLPADKSKRLPPSPRVSKDSINIWFSPTPDDFKKAFASSVIHSPVEGTQHYQPCSVCTESGKVNCDNCHAHGTLICGDCDGTRKVNCHGCNGYGFLNCSVCDSSGFVDDYCPACSSGEVECSGCGGRGSHNVKDFNYVDCRLCNGSGKTRCSRCGGDGSEKNVCTSCNRGQIPCQTCRTQKIITCSECDVNGKVTCDVCTGSTKVGCHPCSGKGGFEIYEEVVFESTITPNSILLSPIADLSKKIKLGFKVERENIQPAFQLKELTDQFPDESFHEPISELYNHVNGARPASSLLDRFAVNRTEVVEVDFKYNDEEGKLLYDVNSKEFYFEKNPLEGAKDRTDSKLQNDFKAALERKDFKACAALISKAQHFKFADLAKRFTSEVEQKKKSIVQARLNKFKWILHPVATIAFGFGTWFVAGFLMPMSIPLLLAMLYLGFRMRNKNYSSTQQPQISFFVNQGWAFLKLSLVFLVILVIVGYLSEYTARGEFMRQFNLGTSLQGQGK